MFCSFFFTGLVFSSAPLSCVSCLSESACHSHLSPVSNQLSCLHSPIYLSHAHPCRSLLHVSIDLTVTVRSSLCFSHFFRDSVCCGDVSLLFCVWTNSYFWLVMFRVCILVSSCTNHDKLLVRIKSKIWTTYLINLSDLLPKHIVTAVTVSRCLNSVFISYSQIYK